VIACHDIYGGSMRLFDRVLARFGMGFDYVDLADPAALTAALRPETRMLWIESPTNPLLQLLDIRALCERAHAAGLIVVVDNTFMSPYFQRPLELGADVVVHSTTKYIGGHSDLVGGAAIVRDADLGDRIAFLSNAMGGVQATFDAWLCLRSLKTLAVRMRAHEANAFAVARFLEAHPGVEDVRYPGLPSHPQHALAQAQMHGFGGMIAARVRGDLAQATRLLESVRVFTLAESLGGVESLIEHPAIMTHASVPAEVRRANGIDDGLLRISVGLEDADDLVSDLAQALAAAAATA
jgi:cystathionine gamma-lyase